MASSQERNERSILPLIGITGVPLRFAALVGLPASMGRNAASEASSPKLLGHGDKKYLGFCHLALASLLLLCKSVCGAVGSLRYS